MSKININSNIGEFFNKNKVRICAFALSTVMIGTLCACKTNTNKTVDSTSISASQQHEQDLLKLKANIEKNISHMEVVKDNENRAYQIIENMYEQHPIYNIDENGNKYVHSYSEKALMYSMEYTVAYEDAEKMGVVELLESQVMGYTKSK